MDERKKGGETGGRRRALGMETETRDEQMFFFRRLHRQEKRKYGLFSPLDGCRFDGWNGVEKESASGWIVDVRGVRG
jgi:hypothetical protein